MSHLQAHRFCAVWLERIPCRGDHKGQFRGLLSCGAATWSYLSLQRIQLVWDSSPTLPLCVISQVAGVGNSYFSLSPP